MALTNQDPHNARELARVIYLSTKAVRNGGKKAARYERQIEAIREKAQAREDAKNNKRR